MSQKKSKLTFEPFNWREASGSLIIGVDEVGRGCLAGPVYACAVALDPSHNTSAFVDSKTLTAKKRELLASEICRHHKVGVGFASVEEISQINILQASFLAMRRALSQLTPPSDCHVLVDGRQKIPQISYQQTTLVKGDMRAEPIGAASIVAKVTRDRLLIELDETYPGYGLQKHKGYSTPFHKEKIKELGPTPIHRKTFAGVKEWL